MMSSFNQQKKKPTTNKHYINQSNKQFSPNLKVLTQQYELDL